MSLGGTHVAWRVCLGRERLGAGLEPGSSHFAAPNLLSVRTRRLVFATWTPGWHRAVAKYLDKVKKETLLGYNGK